MPKYLATYQAQTLVKPEEWGTRNQDQQRLWLAILLACASPGIPITDPFVVSQLGWIWGTKNSVTYTRLLAAGAAL